MSRGGTRALPPGQPAPLLSESSLEGASGSGRPLELALESLPCLSLRFVLKIPFSELHEKGRDPAKGTKKWEQRRHRPGGGTP